MLGPLPFLHRVVVALCVVAVCAALAAWLTPLLP